MYGSAKRLKQLINNLELLQANKDGQVKARGGYHSFIQIIVCPNLIRTGPFINHEQKCVFNERATLNR